MLIRQLASGSRGEISVHVDETGRCEVLDFIERLSDPDLKRVLNLLRLFCDQGEIRNEEKFQHEEDNIYAFKSFQVRILCTFLPTTGKRLVVLLHAFRKKKSPLSKSDLKKAKLLSDSVNGTAGG